MITVRKAAQRGHFDHGWLDTRHTFSFADYHDPEQMGFRALRVINEDRVQPGRGFGTHGHRDMEIISYVLEGALAHRDSTGGGGVLTPGEVQRMSAGTGVRHSEMNGSETEPVHFLQIWLLPERSGIAPGYEQKLFPPAARQDQLALVAARDGREGALTIHQDVDLYSALLSGSSVTHTFKPGRFGWVQVAAGSVSVNGTPLAAGDGAAISEEASVTIDGTGEVLLFDLA
jgi:redox-sensitive bicupin YhaK (pirin superfamily)